jgi:arylsulfatase A-like enzyme
MKNSKLTSLLILVFVTHSPFANAEKKPNFVWILSEDNSIHYLRLYGYELGATPAIESLAKDGIVFNNSFSCGPVCSVARTTLITGCLAPRVGFQYHRKSALANLPDGAQMFPAYLKQAGYYTTNNSKKDYNAVEGKGKVWNDSSRKSTWRNRPDGTPFFHMQTYGQSHESSLHFKLMSPEQLSTPADKVKLFPYFPDTPTFRYTHARYFDRMKVIDNSVGKLVGQLKADGLLEDTFIFYFGDHGGVLPRSKGYIYESGLHVPLVVRIPENWKHLVNLKRGTRTNGFVSFIDFGPTLLNLAGLNVPSHMDGKPFLGTNITEANLNARDETFGYADRFDEKYDFCRTIRKGKYQYIRNYHAFLPDGLQNNYRYKMLAFEEWRKLYKEGKLNAAQSQFFERRPPEQLFDVEDDPHEVNDLSSNPTHEAVLKDLRSRLQKKVKEINDLSFYPESHMVQHALKDGIAYGKAHSAEIARLVDVADLALLPFDEAKPKLLKASAAQNPLERQWAMIACSVFAEQASPIKETARGLLKDDNMLVRTRAAQFLGILGEDPRPTLYEVLNTTQSSLEALITLNAVVFFKDGKPGYDIDVNAFSKLQGKGEVGRRLQYLRVK